MTNKQNAQERRFDAVKMVLDRCYGTSGTFLVDDSYANRMELAELILKLRTLGRTQKWIEACEDWTNLILDTNNAFSWAVLEGHMFCVRACG